MIDFMLGCAIGLVVMGLWAFYNIRHLYHELANVQTSNMALKRILELKEIEALKMIVELKAHEVASETP